MGKVKCCWVLCWFMGLSFIAACQNNDNIAEGEVPEEFRDTSLVSIEEDINPNLSIHESYVSKHEETIRILRNGEAVAIVRLSEPKIIAQADKKEEWGYFQFPKIFRAANENMIVYWQMKEDSYTAYGEEGYSFCMSCDEGETWEALDREYFRRDTRRFEFSNGNVLQEIDPKPKDVNSYTSFPTPVNADPVNGRNFYYESELPDDLRGAYFVLWDKNSNVCDTIHSSIIDPKSLRYTIDDKMPIVWWGDIRKKEDGNLITGIYPAYYNNSGGKVLNSTASFYESKDSGHSWNYLGSIPQKKEYGEGEGYSEPSFLILKDGVLLCIMRTGSTSPMVRSFSYDSGVSWSEPEPFTPNGVSPQLMHLANDILILASGRPGIQVRFNIDGNGQIWTEPVEMLPYENDKGEYNEWLTCGYPSLYKVSDNTFYMVYSDFRTKNENGEYRNSIMFRKFEVVRKP